MRFSRILVPTDFSPVSRDAGDLAVEIARTFDSTVTLVHGFEVPAYAYLGFDMVATDYLSPIEERVRGLLEEERLALSKRWPRCSAVYMRGDAPWRQILRACEEEAGDLIIMGTHGRTGVAHAVLGSVAERVVRLASVPVLTVPARAAERAGDRPGSAAAAE